MFHVNHPFNFRLSILHYFSGNRYDHENFRPLGTVTPKFGQKRLLDFIRRRPTVRMVEQRGRSVAILEVEASVVLAPDILVITRNLDKRLLVGILHQNHEFAAPRVIANQLANQFRRRLPLAQVLSLDFHVI